jgi:hypothetical protein
LKRPNTPSQLLEFTLIGQISYPQGFGPSEVTRKDNTPDENLEWTEDGHSNVDSPLRVDDPDLPTPASQRTPDNIRVLPESTTHTSIEAIHSLPKDSVEGKQRKRKSQKSEILSGTP